MTDLLPLVPAAAVLARGAWLFLSLAVPRGILLFAAIFLISRTIPRLQPALRHGLWFAAVCGFILLPAARWIPPFFTVNGVSGPGNSAAVLLPLTFRQNLEAVIAHAGPSASGMVSGDAWQAVSLAAVAIYLGGAILFAARPFVARRSLRRLEREARPCASLQRSTDSLAGRLGVRRPVTVLVHRRVAIPFTFGFLAPRIFLPAGSVRWSELRRSAVLAHELIHVQRADCLLNRVAYAACAALWFVPPLWIARSYMENEAELSCDLRVIEHGFSRPQYARAILELAACRPQGRVVPAQSLLGAAAFVEDRIRRILRPPAPFGSGGRRGPGVAAVVGVGVLLAGLTLTVGHRDLLFGTWLTRGTSGPAGFAWSPDGTASQYARRYDSNDLGVGQMIDGGAGDVPCSQAPFTIEREWTAADGTTWYQVKAQGSPPGSWRYLLIRVDRSGGTYESQESAAAFPVSFEGPAGAGLHQLYDRK